MTAAMVCGVQEAHNLIVLKGPKHKTALARFTALRCLSLHNTEGLSPGQVCCSPQLTGPARFRLDNAK